MTIEQILVLIVILVTVWGLSWVVGGITFSYGSL